ncbi:beta-1,6-N-acetylglucosaminyltransferase [Falsiroseomonas sp.]|uniref:beta-1,6-N-acetylglucosaminyltransferase n=1 Tax=Falsiroseomonas sp. TaxID=2870721 RepID=UPI00271587C9|nr:beta-1,6-N-acetylglucosaminyltransferase [Falsiroseomonas sp.]MDO9502629.1 beta-1,6-N-acetylglucosaminyltransferase [Falsiroseomonas sp.]
MDRKVAIDPFVEPCSEFGATLMDDRREIFWGGYSMIEAVSDMARKALADPNFTNFLHISGDTYPIVSNETLADWASRDIDQIDHWPAEPDSLVYRRIKNVYLPDSRIGELRSHRRHEERYLSRQIVDSLDEIRSVFEMKHSSNFPITFSKGANWWCLRRATLEMCLDKLRSNRELALWFRYSSNPDESVFNSLVASFADCSKVAQCPVAALWNYAPAPYEFKSVADFGKIASLKQPFARKFAEEAVDLLDHLDKS